MASKPENCNCILCDTEAQKQADPASATVFYECPVCGRFEIQLPLDAPEADFDFNHLGSYLLYNKFSNNMLEPRYYTNRDKEWCDKWKQKYDEGDRTHGRPVHLSKEIVENWYPGNFSEKIDKIVLFLNDQIKHVGEKTALKKEELYSALFVDRFDYSTGKRIKRDEQLIIAQSHYMLSCLEQKGYIEQGQKDQRFDKDGLLKLSLTPEGYDRIDILQKNSANGRNAFVAMQFGDETKSVREAIREGIKKAGYIAIFIDEVQHNDYITPELLKYIKNSRFVVVDLTDKNNGAYFEEGYAMGLEKDVIQICRDDVRLHFDVAQKNTIMWKDENDIIEKLTNRIKATID